MFTLIGTVVPLIASLLRSLREDAFAVLTRAQASILSLAILAERGRAGGKAKGLKSASMPTRLDSVIQRRRIAGRRTQKCDKEQSELTSQRQEPSEEHHSSEGREQEEEGLQTTPGTDDEK